MDGVVCGDEPRLCPCSPSAAECDDGGGDGAGDPFSIYSKFIHTN